MNSCIVMAKIIRSPELRYTQENQTPIATMLVEFEGTRPEEPPATLRVVSWGNMASEVQEKYSEGDRIIIVGRLSMNTIDRPEGFKEKRAELTVSQIYAVDGSDSEAFTAASNPASSASADAEEDSWRSPTPEEPEPVKSAAASPQMKESATATVTASPETSDHNLDDIPF